MSDNIDINSFMDTSFRWFTGVVEDINDPMEMGRIKVRCYGYHTENKRELPTKDLPFFHVMMPITSGSIGGVGQSATGVLRGSWVVGFFRDGHACQDAIVLGTLPSKTPKSTADFNIGFKDPTGEHPRYEDSIDNPKGATSDYWDSKSYLMKTDLRDDSLVEVAGSEDLLQIPTAIPPNNQILTDNKEESYFERKRWIHPDPDNNHIPMYPKNHVKEYESGHVMEVDDTAGRERILTMHTGGTFEEFSSDSPKGGGPSVRTLVVNGNNYQVTLEDDFVSVKGNCNLTVDKDVRVLVKGNYHLEVEGDYTVNVQGNIYKKVGLSEFSETIGDLSHNITGKVTKRIGKSERKLIVGAGLETDDISYNLEVVNNGDIQVGGNLNTVVNGNENRTVLGTNKQVTPTLEFDFTNGNITTASGTITSQTRTLHSHTHSQGADSATNTQAETNAPTADT